MLRTASYTDCGGRPYNEDTCLGCTREKSLCLVVADGLGGHGGGEQASQMAAQVICRGWDGRADKELLTGLIRKANEAVIAIQTPACAMKTTVVALILEGDKAVWAHVGDSRLYHFHNGKLVFQTKDHSVAQLGVMLGDITPDEIRFHPDRSRVLRALGQDGELKVDTAERELEKGKHAFLLCSDGFWEYVMEPEMEQDLSAAKEPDEWIERMRKRLNERIPEDNDNNTAAAAWLEIL